MKVPVYMVIVPNCEINYIPVAWMERVPDCSTLDTDHCLSNYLIYPLYKVCEKDLLDEDGSWNGIIRDNTFCGIRKTSLNYFDSLGEEYIDYCKIVESVVVIHPVENANLSTYTSDCEYLQHWEK
jgi:hypothetical protein